MMPSQGIAKMNSAQKKIIVKDSDIHGHGVFALAPIAADETIELCTYLVIDDDDLQDANRLNDYLFNSPGAEGDYLLMMGHGMLYNHSDESNASWEIHDDNRFVRFYATKDIAAGEEIVHDYGSEYWETRQE